MITDTGPLLVRHPFPSGAVAFGLAATGAAALGSSVHPGWFIASIPLFAMAIGLWAFRLPLVHARLESDGIAIDSDGQHIPYASIRSLTLAGRSQDPLLARELKNGPLTIVHSQGTVDLVGLVDPSPRRLYCWLLTESALPGSDKVVPQLTAHLAEERERFGNDKVWSFCRRPRLGRAVSTRRGRACALLVILSGIAFPLAAALLLPAKNDIGPWFGFGLMTVLGGVLFWFMLKRRERPRRCDRLHAKGNASLIVSPSGIALVQDDLSGLLQWDELLDVALAKRCQAIDLRIAGTHILVMDIYDRPLPVICQVIRRFWRGPQR